MGGGDLLAGPDTLEGSPVPPPTSRTDATVFDTLSDRLSATFKHLRGKGSLSEADYAGGLPSSAPDFEDRRHRVRYPLRPPQRDFQNPPRQRQVVRGRHRRHGARDPYRAPRG